VVEIMGHRAGWLTLGAGIAGGADVILIPEIPYDVECIADAIRKRSAAASRSASSPSPRAPSRVQEFEALRDCPPRGQETGQEKGPVAKSETDLLVEQPELVYAERTLKSGAATGKTDRPGSARHHPWAFAAWRHALQQPTASWRPAWARPAPI
jgi:hypothetical protein